MHKKKIKIAVFPIAGMGTRFLPITKTISKEMLNILDRPLLDYAVEEAKAAIDVVVERRDVRFLVVP